LLQGEVYFHTDGAEADFIVKEGMKITRAIQVWYDDVAVNTVPDRELACFKTSEKGFDQAERILITNDYDSTIDIGSKQVQCIPVA
jgi:predicted AAA+ superfamily ATPase